MREKRWIDAGIDLADDPHNLVNCPACQGQNLIVEDVPSDIDTEHFERYLKCPSCGAYNVLRLKKRDKE